MSNKKGIRPEIKVIFEDGEVCVIDKPAGMVVNRSQTNKQKTVQDWFAPRLKVESDKLKVNEEFFDKGGIVHRLDKDTSGLMILAKTLKSYNSLKSQFLERKVTKTYIALVHGEVKPEKGIISKPIERHPKIWGKFTIGRDLSKTAVTEWKTISHYSLHNNHYSFMELRPLTGRTHQIRVHMKHLGYPVVADRIYLNKKTYEADKLWCPRLFLHAIRLEIIHPETRNIMNFDSDLSDDLKQATQKLIN